MRPKTTPKRSIVNGAISIRSKVTGPSSRRKSSRPPMGAAVPNGQPWPGWPVFDDG
jgi:hypothetical protein